MRKILKSPDAMGIKQKYFANVDFSGPGKQNLEVPVPIITKYCLPTQTKQQNKGSFLIVFWSFGKQLSVSVYVLNIVTSHQTHGSQIYQLLLSWPVFEVVKISYDYADKTRAC